MPGQRRLDRNLRGFNITNFADHYHIRILAQNCAQATRKAHVHFGVDLGLTNAVNVVLDRIFDRQNIARGVIQTQQTGIQRRGFARAGRPGDQENSMRPVDQIVNAL